MRLNLDPIRRVVEEITMRDECEITTDPQGVGDDVWDPATGTYTPPAGDRTVLYTGICSIYPFSGVIQAGERGDEQIMETRYWVGIPMSEEVEVPPEALIEITAVDPDQGDPMLVGEWFVVDEQELQTMASSRRFNTRHLKAKP